MPAPSTTHNWQQVSTALFPLIVLLLIINVPLSYMPAPATPQMPWKPGEHVRVTLFPLMVLLLIINVPLLNMPPPIPATFPLTVLWFIVSVPILWMPPPPPRPIASPLVIVTPERATLAFVMEVLTTMLCCPPLIQVVLA